MITIRPYTSQDVASLAELMHDLGYPTTADKMTQRMKQIEEEPNHATFVATIGGDVVGMIGIRRVYFYEEDGTATQISALVTKKDFEGRGVGKALVKHAEKVAIEHGAAMLYLTSGAKPERQRAHEFYKRQGFDVNGYRFVKRIAANEDVEV